MKRICVIGSINMDLTAVVARFPKPGETVTGVSFASYPGGKGANQAVAAGRLGGDVSMFGKVGNDSFGEQYIRIFESGSVKSGGISVEKGASTGIAVIQVDGSGENNIIVVPGANELVDRLFIDSHYKELGSYDIFLFQLEIPLDTVIYAMKRLKEDNKIVLLDPAPARLLPDEIYQYVDFITPNETEIEILTGRKADTKENIKSAAELLLVKGVKNVIVKAGREGAYLVNGEGLAHMIGFKVKAVDTTAAGDSFNGGFAYSLALGNDVRAGIRFANAVAAISTTSLGAQSAMPDLTQVKSLLGD